MSTNTGTDIDGDRTDETCQLHQDLQVMEDSTQNDLRQIELIYSND